MSEQELVRHFVAHLLRSTRVRREEDGVQVSSEFDYARGRTDIVAISIEGDVMAFEAKLERWRTALHQAYRNTCFSDRSYVVLPLETALRASAFEHEFAVRRVGLVGVSAEGAQVLLEAPRSTPTEPWLTRLAREHIRVSQSNVEA